MPTTAAYHYQQPMAAPMMADQQQAWGSAEPDFNDLDFITLDAETMAAAAMAFPLLPGFADAFNSTVSSMAPLPGNLDSTMSMMPLPDSLEAMPMVPLPNTLDVGPIIGTDTAGTTPSAGTLTLPILDSSTPTSSQSYTVGAASNSSFVAPNNAVQVIAPVPVPSPIPAPIPVIAPAPAAGASSKKWASDEDWDRHRPTITRMYVKENKKLWQIVDHMSNEFGFYATPKMYKTRFKRWGLWKNTKAADVAEVLRQSTSTTSASDTTTTVTTTTTTTTVTTTKSRNRSDQQVSESKQVFLVNGKHVDSSRIERYIRNRCRQYRLRPTDLSASLIQAASASALNKPAPLGLSSRWWKGGSSHLPGTSAALIAEEKTYRTIYDYFEGSLTSGRWVFETDATCDPSTEGGQEMAQIISQFHERFKVAAPLLAKPGTKEGAEGVKMARICFAEIPIVLNGKTFGAEDPNFLIFFLIVLQHIRTAGGPDGKLRWLETQLVRYVADLAFTLPGALPHQSVWAMLRDNVVSGCLTDNLSLQIARVTVDVCRRLLGPYHIKTIEMLLCGFLNFEKGPNVVEEQEHMLIEMLADLDALGIFDERHAGVRMNLASFYNLHEMPEKAAAVAREVTENEWMLGEAKKYRGMATQFYYEIAASDRTLGRFEQAELAYRDAVDMAKWEISTGNGNNANLLDSLVKLEDLLREMGETEKADEVERERNVVIQENLKNVGELDESVLVVG
ncbi:hypothetical protein B0H63DRAFT_451386 [Podospora didyma]|uniref:Clr5 domain-containing protein n=1 Tax=Podospora didyma TaxID=330526 RepID=A0AAE0KKF1_9PEZI|nr:hypothetical protein B0H63DRAFT_451386 [Podospora didyma]